MIFNKWKLFAFYDLLIAFYDNHITYKKYPKLENSYSLNNYNKLTYEDVGIIIQGDWVQDASYTLNTVKIYKKIFPKSKIIISIWKLNFESKEALMKLGVHLILNKDIPNPGIKNINRQITTTLAGVELAKKLGCQYCMKTRTDQRVCSSSAISSLKNNLIFFKEEEQKKIIAASRNTFKYRLYGISDMFQFGRTGDILLFWSCPLDPRDPVKQQPARIESLFDFANWCICEVYLVTNYLKKLNVNIAWTLKHYREVLASYFIIIDSAALGIHWFKYSYRDSIWHNYTEEIRAQEVEFNDWLLYYNQVEFNEDESIIYSPIDHAN